MPLPVGGGARSPGSRVARVVVAIAVVVGLISCVLGFVRSARDLQRLNADVGDCVTGETEADVRIVDCADPTALRRVLYGTTTPSPVTQDDLDKACADAPLADHIFWKTLEDGTVLILCLETLKP
ncbi:LppU/SCO3897 family protein [Micromonospora sp. SH-82]|uniref:LppU/SCO3897 family protein n=1 Tax=Micromonospora sp. SH-82 TaxID=3132938 RepID=UPI003EBF8A29